MKANYLGHANQQPAPELLELDNVRCLIYTSQKITMKRFVPLRNSVSYSSTFCNNLCDNHVAAMPSYMFIIFHLIVQHLNLSKTHISPHTESMKRYLQIQNSKLKSKRMNSQCQIQYHLNSDFSIQIYICTRCPSQPLIPTAQMESNCAQSALKLIFLKRIPAKLLPFPIWTYRLYLQFSISTPSRQLTPPKGILI
jgi:hypothetical protein